MDDPVTDANSNGRDRCSHAVIAHNGNRSDVACTCGQSHKTIDRLVNSPTASGADSIGHGARVAHFYTWLETGAGE